MYYSKKYQCNPEKKSPMLVFSYSSKEAYEVLDDIIECKPNLDVYCADDLNGDFDRELYELEINDGSCMVVAITEEFFEKGNRSFEVDIDIARKHKMRIIPVLVDELLEKKFNEEVGTLHCIFKRTDKGKAKYLATLREYINDVSISDELQKKIREAFDAYIFISYRKKNIAQAKEFINRIHESDFMRDCAIWYDEYLVPGEDFNDAISRMIEKSDLFALVVTSDLFEQGNYVLENEYPHAVNSGKKVLAVKSSDYDDSEFAKVFGDLNVISVEDRLKLTERAKNLLVLEAKRENEDYQHLYLMGMAYLLGIDVERDVDKAIELLAKSSELFERNVKFDYFGEYIEPLASEELVEIFSSRHELERIDIRKAIYYQNYIYNWDLRYKTDCLDANDKRIARSGTKLGRILMMRGDYKNALKILEDTYMRYGGSGGVLMNDNIGRRLEIMYGYCLSCFGYEGRSALSTLMYQKDDFQNLTRLMKTIKEKNDHIEWCVEDSIEDGIYNQELLGARAKGFDFNDVYGQWDKGYVLSDMLSESEVYELGLYVAMACYNFGDAATADAIIREIANYSKNIGCINGYDFSNVKDFANNHYDLAAQYSEAMNKSGRYEESLTYGYAALEKQMDVFKEDSIQVLTLRRCIANSLFHLGKSDESRKEYEEVFKQCDLVPGMDVNQSTWKQEYAEFFCSLEEKIAIYEKYFDSEMSVVEKRGMVVPPSLLDILAKLLEAYLEANNYDKALEYIENIFIQKTKELVDAKRNAKQLKRHNSYPFANKYYQFARNVLVNIRDHSNERRRLWLDSDIAILDEVLSEETGE